MLNVHLKINHSFYSYTFGNLKRENLGCKVGNKALKTEKETCHFW